jgi:hypothetical protein
VPESREQHVGTVLAMASVGRLRKKLTIYYAIVATRCWRNSGEKLPAGASAAAGLRTGNEGASNSECPSCRRRLEKNWQVTVRHWSMERVR